MQPLLCSPTLPPPTWLLCQSGLPNGPGRSPTLHIYVQCSSLWPECCFPWNHDPHLTNPSRLSSVPPLLQSLLWSTPRFKNSHCNISGPTCTSRTLPPLSRSGFYFLSPWNWAGCNTTEVACVSTHAHMGTRTNTNTYLPLGTQPPYCEKDHVTWRGHV